MTLEAQRATQQVLFF